VREELDISPQSTFMSRVARDTGDVADERHLLEGVA
jgi:hypothetical protein